jgi:hypothetical protein
MSASWMNTDDSRPWPRTVGGMTFGNDAKRGRIKVCDWTNATFVTDGIWREGEHTNGRQYRAQRYNEKVWLREDSAGDLVFA